MTVRKNCPVLSGDCVVACNLEINQISCGHTPSDWPVLMVAYSAVAGWAADAVARVMAQNGTFGAVFAARARRGSRLLVLGDSGVWQSGRRSGTNPSQRAYGWWEIGREFPFSRLKHRLTHAPVACRVCWVRLSPPSSPPLPVTLLHFPPASFLPSLPSCKLSSRPYLCPVPESTSSAGCAPRTGALAAAHRPSHTPLGVLH